MKKLYLLLLICVTLCIQVKSQTYYFIPDVNFRSYLVSIGKPFNAGGDSLMVSSGLVSSTVLDIDCSYRNISNLDGVQFFTYLRNLDCSHNLITSFPKVAAFTERIVITHNLLTSIDSLPENIDHLDLAYNPLLTSLPELPLYLTYLDFSGCPITHLDSLPPLMSQLKCSYTPISYLPPFPMHLVTFYCDHSALDSLPIMPTTISHLYCGNNHLSNLESVLATYTYLWYLNVDSTGISHVGPWSPDCREISCKGNLISDLGVLPSGLTYLDCRDNPNLICLPFLPNTLDTVYLDAATVTCLPNNPTARYMSPSLGTLPYCDAHIHSCPSYGSILGFAYSDDNSNCLRDVSEATHSKVNFILSKDSVVLAYGTTASSDGFLFEGLALDSYTLTLDTVGLPFVPVCPISAIDTVVMDSVSLSVTEANFALGCKPGFDLSTDGLVSTSEIRPADTATFEIHAGDIARRYGVACTSISAKIEVEFGGPMRYLSAAPGTIVPDSIYSNRLVWMIANIGAINYRTAIKSVFYVDSSAVDGDFVCFNTKISSSSGDRDTSNNHFEQCFTVLASYDPNFKEVSPSGSISSSQDWLYYTIHFQNTGSSYAQNVYLWDTLDTHLDLSSIQVIASSHTQIMQAYPSTRAIKFSFINIHLLDSTTDEAASHGYVQYRVKLVSGLSEGTVIENTAAIYFDLNPPVLTNTAVSNICNTPSISYLNFEYESGVSYHVGDHIYDRPGIYTDVFNNVFGCDSIVRTSILITPCAPAITDSQSYRIFLGSSISVFGHVHNSTGIYHDTLLGSRGCDSLIFTSNLLVVDCSIPITGSVHVSISLGDTLFVGSHFYIATGTYVDTLSSYLGCDSIHTTDLTVIVPCGASTTNTQSFTIHLGDSISVTSHTYTSTGVYHDTIRNIDGCDSIIILTNLLVIDCTIPTISSTHLSILSGDSVVVGLHVYSHTGTYVDSFLTYQGCDSIHTTFLIVIIPCDSAFTNTQSITIHLGSHITVGSHTYSSSGVYHDTLLSIAGCDSIILITNLEVIDCTIPIITTITVSIHAGEHIVIGAHLYDSAGTYVDSLMNYLGCDSIIITHLTMISGIEKLLESSIQVFPNPANQELKIEIQTSENLNVYLFDVYGKKVYASQIAARSFIINTENFVAGTYFLQVGDTHRKIVIQH